MAFDPNKPVHYASDPFEALCGADSPGQQTTTALFNVTCPCCLGNHNWTGQKTGGPPDATESHEWVGYCADCGAERTD